MTITTCTYDMNFWGLNEIRRGETGLGITSWASAQVGGGSGWRGLNRGKGPTDARGKLIRLQRIYNF